MRACEGTRVPSHCQIQKGKLPDSRTSWVNKSWVKTRKRDMETEKKTGKKWNWWISKSWQRYSMEFGKVEERSRNREQEEGSRKFLCDFPDPLSFTQNCNMTILLLFFSFPCHPSCIPKFPLVNGSVHLTLQCTSECIPQFFWQWLRNVHVCNTDMFIPHIFQQITFGLVLKVQPCHLLCVCVFQLLCHFDLGETKRQVKDLSFIHRSAVHACYFFCSAVRCKTRYHLRS